MEALKQGALLVKNIKNVVIDGDALFKTQKGLTKVVIDALRKLGDTSAITIMTTDEATMKKAVSDAFTVEQVVDVPYMEEIKKDDGTTFKVRKYRKEPAKIQLVQPLFHEIGQKDDPIGDFLRWIDLQRESSPRDLWIITSNPKIIKRYFQIQEIFMQPNDDSVKTGTGVKFRMIFVKDAAGWKSVVDDDKKDTVESKESKKLKDAPDEVDDVTEAEAEKEAAAEEKIEEIEGVKPQKAKNTKYM